MNLPRFGKKDTLRDFQRFVEAVYALPDDRLYSLQDLLTHEQRFAMRALKGIRKGDMAKLEQNLLIAFSWTMAIANRIHIDVEDEVWKRFPNLCSYCGKRPCACRAMKPRMRPEIRAPRSGRPKSLEGYQTMFATIYSPASRSLADAGVHLAEEVGETSEAVQNYLGEHKERQFGEVKAEIADLASCIFGVANSARIKVATSLARMFPRGCHACHKAPCECSFSEVAKIRT